MNSRIRAVETLEISPIAGADYRNGMTARGQHIVWVRRDDAENQPDHVLRHRIGVDDETVEVKTKVVSRWGHVMIPEGARDESGDSMPLLNVSFQVLPLEGRVYLIGPERG